MSIFGNSSDNPKTINNVQVTQSTQGYPIPAAMGQVRMQQSLMFLGAVNEQKQTGGKGGGKGNEFYLYYADVVAALCNGSVTSIGHVWSNQSWLAANATSDNISITANYSPANAAVLIADNGVTLANTYSQTFNDYGQPASTVLNGTDNAPMVQVPYGTTLTTGHYSVSFTSIGTFTLSAAGNASGGSTVYTGTFSSPSGASNAFAGFKFTVAGFPNSLNNGTFLCTASSTTTITLSNASGVSQSHAATAEDIGNTYHFAAADVGKSAAVWYQYNYSMLLQQDIAIVPTAETINGTSVPYAVQVSNQYTPTSNVNVQYYGEGNPNAGVTLTQVYTTPTVAGTYQFFSAISGGGAYYTYYKFSSADLGNEIMMTWGYTNQSAVGQSAPELINFELFGGGIGQAIWPFLESGGSWALGGGSSNVATGTMPGNAAQALGYSGIAYIGYGPMFLGDSGQVQDNTFEVITPDGFGGGIGDCNPVTCIYKVLTNTQWGLGSGTVPFPLSAIDNGSSGTWGGAVGTPGTRQTGSTAWNWFAANNFFISPKIDSQDTAASVMSKWLEAGQCAAFMSEGLLKLVPYGSTSVANNGCTWEGPQNFIVALDDSCFIAKEGEDPIKVERNAWQDAYNKVQVSYSNRANQYQDDICQEWDQAAINRYGLRVEDPQSYDFIKTLNAAIFAANMRVKRMTNIRNTYTFTLPFSYSYLEPMDIVTITSSSIWAAGLNDENLSLNNFPIRVTKVIDDPVKGLELTCEDYQAWALEPVLFNKGISGGSTVANAWAQPGNSEVVLFEATNRLTKQQGNQIWIGACGLTANWGSTNIWVSQDQVNYLQVGTITQPARLGVLYSSLATGSDPDTTHTMVVTLAENCQPLDAGSGTDADNGTTMCFVDGEIISYSACTVTADNTYSMGTYLRRGQMGSTIAAHSAGGLFMRLDQSVFQYQYDPQWAGQTLYFKFQSVNRFGNNAQLLSSLTATAFTVPGLNPGTIDASSGLDLTPNFNGTGYGPLGWAPITTGTYGGGGSYSSGINFCSSSYGFSGGNPNYEGAQTNYFYGRWTGFLVPSATGEYTIGINSDDGANLYIGGMQVGTNELATDRAAGANCTYSSGGSAQILLTKGVYYPLVIEHQNYTAPFALQLVWTPPKSSAQLIPATNLSNVSTSVTGVLNYSIWNGSAGLWYPSGNGLIDPANTTLYGPPTNGGGTPFATMLTNVTNSVESFSAENSFPLPGWVTGQIYSNGGQFCLFFPSAANIDQGYVFNFTFNGGGGSQCYAESTSNITTFTTAAVTNLTYYTPGNTGSASGWYNVAIYVGTAGYMSAWVNNSIVCDFTDTTYALVSETRNIKYGYTPGWSAYTYKIAPPPNASGAGSSGLNTQANLAGVTDYTFTYGYTSVTITWTWTTFNVYFADGITISVAGGNQTFSGLSAGNTYYFMPCAVIGGTNNSPTATVYIGYTGTSVPTVAQQAQVANGDNSVACNANIYVTGSIPSGGGSGSGGGGGGSLGGVCFSPNTEVKTRRGNIAITELLVGQDEVLTARGTWKVAESITTRDWDGPLLDMGGGEFSTPTHHVIGKGNARMSHWTPMEDCGYGFPLVQYKGTIHNVRVKADPDDDGTQPDTERSYTLENGLVVHNARTV